MKRGLKKESVVLSDGRNLSYVVDRQQNQQQQGDEDNVDGFSNNNSDNDNGSIPTLFFFPGMFGKVEFIIHRKIFETKLNLVYVDRPGYGGSDPVPSVEEWAYRNFANDIEELANHLRIDKFYVAGHSIGGPCALACGAHIGPQQILGVISIAGDAEYAAEGAPNDFGGGFLGRIIVQWIIPSLILILSLGGICGPFSHLVTGSKVDYKVEREPYDFKAEEIVVPTLFLHGSNDPFVPPICSTFTQKRIPKSQILLIPDADHMSIINRKHLDLAFSRILQMTTTQTASANAQSNVAAIS